MMEEDYPDFFQVGPINFDAELEYYQWSGEEYPDRRKVVIPTELLAVEGGKDRGKHRDSSGVSSSGVNCRRESASKKATGGRGSNKGDRVVPVVKRETNVEPQVFGDYTESKPSFTEDEDDSGSDSEDDAQLGNRFTRLPCKFCSFLGESEEALALHESLEHSKPSQILQGLGLPKSDHRGQRRRRLYYCARCSFVGNSKKRYVNHHLAVHQGVETPGRKYEGAWVKLEPSSSCSQDIQRSSDGMISDAESRNTCRDCYKKFYYLKQLWSHRRESCVLRHTFIWIADCPVTNCDLKFESVSDLDYHLTIHHSSDKLKGVTVKCSMCDYNCLGQRGLITHMATHTPPQPPPPPVVIPNPGLNPGIRGEHPPGNWPGFPCTVCTKRCSTKQSLQVHLRTHTGEKPFVCPVCGEGFAYKHVLKRHEIQMHPQNGLGLGSVIPRSGSNFPLKSPLFPDVGSPSSNDMKDLKTGEFQCDQCSKHFSSKQALQVHTRLHTGELPFTCRICGEKFRYRQFLRSHVNEKHKDAGVQDLPRPYRKAQESGGGSSSSSSGDGNIGPGSTKSWPGLPPKPLPKYPCPQCSKTFSTKQSMQVHLRVHTGEMPFSCWVCGDKFRYRHVLRSHVNSRHGQEGVQDLPRPYNKSSSSVESSGRGNN